MLRFRDLGLVGLVAFTAAGTAHAQCGTGGGRVLDMPTDAPMASLITIHLDSPPPATHALLMFSLGQGPVDLGTYGTICLDFPPAVSLVLPFDSSGHAELTVEIPCDPSFIGITVYGQFITCSPGNPKGSHGSSNQDASTIVDGVGNGSFCTYNQLGWGSDCVLHEAGCLLLENFDVLFPNGIVIGDADGIDGDGFFASLWTLVGKIQHFLPQTLRCATLALDRENPICDSGWSLGGNLLAAKLNVAFDDAGLFDDKKCRDDVKLGDLELVGCVDEDLIGWTVRDLIALADGAISLELGAGPFDIDGDGKADVTLFEICDALEVVNENFKDCIDDNGCLGLP